MPSGSAVPASWGPPTISNPLLPNQQARNTESILRHFDNGLNVVQIEPAPEDTAGVHRDTEDNFRMPPQATDFIANNLKNFYHRFDSGQGSSIKQMIQEVTVRAQNVTEKFGLDPIYTPRLALLALYDFVILCGMCLRLI
jgi:hypothetical protein